MGIELLESSLKGGQVTVSNNSCIMLCCLSFQTVLVLYDVVGICAVEDLKFSNTAKKFFCAEDKAEVSLFHVTK